MWHSFEMYKLFATEYFQCVIFFFNSCKHMDEPNREVLLTHKCLLHRKFPTDLKCFLFLFYVARIQIQKKALLITQRLVIKTLLGNVLSNYIKESAPQWQAAV